MIRTIFFTALFCFSNALAQNPPKWDGFIGLGNSTFPASNLNAELDDFRFELHINYNLNPNALVMFGVHGGPKAHLERGGFRNTHRWISWNSAYLGYGRQWFNQRLRVSGALTFDKIKTHYTRWHYPELEVIDQEGKGLGTMVNLNLRLYRRLALFAGYTRHLDQLDFTNIAGLTDAGKPTAQPKMWYLGVGLRL